MTKNIIGLVLATIFIFGTFQECSSQKKVDQWNEYSEKISPIAVEQDGLIDQINQLFSMADPDALALLPAIISKSESQKQGMRAISSEDSEVQAMHDLMIQRADLIHSGLLCLQRELSETCMDDFVSAGAKLDEFAVQKAAYGKKHDIEFE